MRMGDGLVMPTRFAHRELAVKRHVRCQRDDFPAAISQCDRMAAGSGSFGDNLRKARNELGWTLEKLADEAGTSKGYLSDLEHGRRETPPGAKLADIAQALGVTAAELVGGRGEDRRRTVPLVGYVGAGAVAHYYASADEGLGDVDAPDDASKDTVAVEVRGTSLGPLFEYWLVFYDEVRTPVTADLFGKLCVVGLPDGRVLVKKIRPARSTGLFHLESNTEPTMPDEEIVWAARVKSMTPR